MSSFFFKRACWLVLCAVTSLTAAAQLPGVPKIAPEPTTPPVTDPLGRDTPNGTVYGFLHAVQTGNYATAAQYLQMTNAKRAAQGEELAKKLKIVMDRAFSGNLRLISNQPEGSPQEGSSPNQQRLGPLSAGDVDAELDLVRVPDPSGAKIWLISSDTLAKVPDLYDRLEVHQVEAHLPDFLVQYEFLGIAIWQWLAILLAIPIAAALGWLTVRLMGLYQKLRRHPPIPRPGAWNAISNPLWLVFATVYDGMLVRQIGLPLLARHHHQEVIGVVFIVAWAWLLSRIVQQIARRVREGAIRAGRAGTGSLLLLGERVLKAIISIAAIFAILSSLGVNMTTALAGLGIGGIAIAFAAQKTLENLFGGVSLLGDEVIRVGDICRFGDKTGTVEDISLRSTRIRTPERIELSIPNGSLATMNIENLSRRDKILFNTKLSLRYETSADQLRYVLAQIRRLLYEHPKVETDGARIRFIGYDNSSLNLEVFCYILTRDGAEFLAIQEDLLLRILDIVEASGTTFAFPSRVLYLSRDTGLDQEKTASVSHEVQQWRESSKLPFPDYAPADISGFSNSLPYPQPESALRTKK
ncbi:MAG TPA: mechanosensitive ion channel family protein [Terriglobales bacterium]|nr:mechanosensitive ion channel family protein [Terriglobales bacterium]